jgi:hypothetical protein
MKNDIPLREPRWLLWASGVATFAMILWLTGALAWGMLDRWRPQERVLMQAWGWVQSCTAQVPERGKNPYGDLDHIVWQTFKPGAMNDVATPGWRVIGVTARTAGLSVDTIYIDTEHQDTVWVIAHELLHHVLGDSTVWGSDHPFIPFAFPCHLFEWQQDGIGILGQGGKPPRARIP